MQSENKNRPKILKDYSLEPRTLGELIDLSVNVFKDNFQQYIVLSLIIYSPIFLLNIILPFSTAIGRESPGCFFFLLAIFAVIGAMMCWTFLITAVAIFTSEIFKHNYLTYKEAVRLAKEKFWSVLAVIIISNVFIFFISFLTIGLSFLLLKAGDAGASSVVGILIVVFLGINYAAYLVFRYTLAPYVVLFEDMRGLDALRRSSALFHSSWDAVIKISLIPFVIPIMMMVFSLIPFVGGFLSIFIASLPIIATTLLYYDIRLRTEGFDLEISAERMMKEIAEAQDR